MKILFFTPVNISFKGGFENWLYEFTKSLKKKGHYIHVIDTEYPEHKEIKWRTINERTTIRTKKFHRITSSDVKRIKKISGDYDVLYFNQVNMGHAKIFSKLKIKKIAGYHAPLFRNHLIFDAHLKLLGKKYLRRFDAHHVINSMDLSQIKKWGFKNTFLIHDGVDIKHFNCKKKPSRHDKFRILFVGRHELQKGFDVLLKAIKEISDKNIIFTFTGRGLLTKNLLELTKENKNVRYKGFVKDVRMEYCSNDLLIIPSRQEPFGLVIIEAQSCKLPVLSTNTCGARDIIKDNKTGFIMDELSVKELIKNINEVHDIWKRNRVFLKRMGKTARDEVVTNYSLNIINKKLFEMFKEVLNK